MHPTSLYSNRSLPVDPEGICSCLHNDSLYSTVRAAIGDGEEAAPWSFILRFRLAADAKTGGIIYNPAR